MKLLIGLLAVVVLALGGVWYWACRSKTDVTPPPVVGGADMTTSKSADSPADAAAKSAELLKQGRAAATEGNPAKARSLFEQAAKDYPDTWGAREANLELGIIYYKAGMKKEAADAMRKGLPGADDKRQPQVLARIRQIEEEIAKAPAPAPAPSPTPSPTPAPVPTPTPVPTEGDTTYSVVKGDTMTAIAKKMKVTVEQIKLANNRADDRINIGDKLVVSHEMPAIAVSKGKLTLTFFYKGAQLKQYPVCIGKDIGPTPAGVYTVGIKQKNPDWFKPGGKKVPYGDPENILGTRWMTLISADGVAHGYGVHGTTKPETVPGRDSAGCVRMLNPDVEQIYEWVPTGTKVTVTEE